MSNTHISINDATINTKEFTEFLQKALERLDAAREATLDFKEIVEDAANNTKIDKRVISKFFKARFKDKTKEVVKEGELFSALNSAVDD